MLMRHMAMATVLSMLAAPALADAVWVGGASLADTTQVAYLGRVGPLPGKKLADGWSQSVFVDYVSYEYDSATQRINGKVYDIKFSVGREFRRDYGSLGLSLGVSAGHTTLRPDDPGNTNRRSSVNPVVEGQWQSKPDAGWRSSAYGQYVFGARRDFAMAFVGHRLWNRLALGPQVSTGGGPDYRFYGLALALNGWKIGPLDVGFYAGAQHSEGGDTHPEVGLSFVAYRPD
jgi:hypothetical protein